MTPLQSEERRKSRLLVSYSLPQMIDAYEGAGGSVRGRLLAVSYIFAVPAVVDQRILDRKERQKRDSGSAVLGFDMTAAVSIQDRSESQQVCFASVVSMTAMTSVV